MGGTTRNTPAKDANGRFTKKVEHPDTYVRVDEDQQDQLAKDEWVQGPQESLVAVRLAASSYDDYATTRDFLALQRRVASLENQRTVLRDQVNVQTERAKVASENVFRYHELLDTERRDRATDLRRTKKSVLYLVDMHSQRSGTCQTCGSAAPCETQRELTWLLRGLS